ncbi:MAG: thioredoxin family protein [Prevotellaceae bacterium]|jgi:thiol:disulfide interchange protein DsbD|nr:thioredoxin family protein [Prevotellaceae bacterium]
MKKIFPLSLFLAVSLPLFAQSPAITWTAGQRPATDGTIELTFTADIAAPWYIYGVRKMDGPLPTAISMENTAAFALEGALAEASPAKEKFDEMFETTVYYFKERATFVQKIRRLTGAAFTVSGTLEYQSCSDRECIPNEYAFSIEIPAGGAAASGTEEQSLWLFLLVALAAGIGAVFTPCVFPMIPMTVSFFIGGSTGRYSGIVKAVIFALSVTLAYTLIGVVVTVFKTPAFANVLSVHWIPNLLFAALFIIFALSFFGLFEITLPSSLASRADRKVDKGGYVAAFFMAIVLAVVSFSCTGPFVGGLLIAAAQGTPAIKPVIGMCVFGLAMSLPFVLLALFPAWLKKLPKSGGWLNSVKVVFAFILLAFCVKFLTQAELSLNCTILTRETAVAFWITLSVLLGFYILGKIKLPHDSEVTRVSVGRLVIAIAAFTFAGYLLPGLFGADLDAVSAFLPAKDRQQFDLTHPEFDVTLRDRTYTSLQEELPQDVALCGNTPKYAGTKMHAPAGVRGYFDLQEALACAKTLNRPVLIDFTGHGCVNCKKMEASTFKDPRVIKLINDRFVWVSLYYDDPTELPLEEQTDGYKTVGKKNRAYQMETFKTVASPYFAIITAGGEIVAQGLGLASADEFLEWAEQ